jgi:hypothetical protein
MIDIFKIKIPAIYSKELASMYDFLFDELNCGWAGRLGHYAYDEDKSKVAENQDGFIYCWKHEEYSYKISASPDSYLYRYPIPASKVPELLLPYGV